jgi:serine/threonine-protein kinase
VFRTYEPTRDRLVAVKVFRLDIVPEQAKSLAEELTRAAEAGLFHPSIVEPVAAGIEGTLAYRAEEYVAAESLDVAMRHYAPAPIEKALPFITQLAGAIDFARAAGVGHGALHPRDIFVTPDEARATGFGVVEALERAGVRAPVRRPYTAPERIERNEWGTPADVFSLAAIAFELLTGRRPAGTGAHIGALNATGDERTDVLHAVLARAMDDDPSRRYPNALAFAGALESASRAERGPARAQQPLPIVSPPVSAPLPEPPPAPTVQPPSARALPLEPPAPSPGEFRVEEQLDPVHRAIEDVKTERKIARKERDKEHEPVAAATLTPPPEVFSHHDIEPEPEPRLDRFTPEADVEPEPAYAATATIGVDAAPEPEFRHRGPTFGIEPEPRDAPERSRPAILPIAVTLVVGLLAGFAAGYFVGGRDQVPVATTTTAANPRPPTAAAPSSTSNPKPFSDQAVGSTTPSPAPTGAPATEAPPTVSEDAPSTPTRPATTASATPTRPQPPPAAAATTGRLVVRSTPARASVTVNGQWRGRTPLTLEKLAFGRYVVRVVEPGYRVEREDFALSPRDAAHSMNVQLVRENAARSTTPATRQDNAARAPQRPSTPQAPGTSAFSGALFVDSRPQGANVLLDGKIVGKTPLRLPDVRIGTHVVRIELAEHRPWSSVARITAGQEYRVTGSLERFQ